MFDVLFCLMCSLGGGEVVVACSLCLFWTASRKRRKQCVCEATRQKKREKRRVTDRERVVLVLPVVRGERLTVRLAVAPAC